MFSSSRMYVICIIIKSDVWEISNMEKIKLFFKLNSSKIIISVSIIVFIIVCILLPVTLMIINPMQRPAFMIRNQVLSLTPIGTHIDDVIIVIESNENWHWNGHISGAGFRCYRQQRWIGERSIRAGCGAHWPSAIFFRPIMGLLTETSTTIFWGFDEDGKLIDVYVHQSFR